MPGWLSSSTPEQLCIDLVGALQAKDLRPIRSHLAFDFCFGKTCGTIRQEATSNKEATRNKGHRYERSKKRLVALVAPGIN